MTLKQLEAFYWAATCTSFAIAAQRLNITVSSLSKRIAELELSLDAVLFNRDARQAVLTPAGEHLVPHARDLLGHTGRFMAVAKNSSVIEGRCRFGAGELTGLTWLPQMIDAMQQAHPNLLIEPSIAVGQVIEKALANGELDFALIAGPSTRSEIASQIIGAADFTWTSCPTLRSGIDVSQLLPGGLCSVPLISLPSSAGTVRILDDWLAEQQVTPERTMTCENWGSVAGLIRHGLGVGFLPSAWARLLIERGALIELEHFPPLRPLQYTFQWRRDDNRSIIEQARNIAIESVDFSAPTCLV